MTPDQAEALFSVAYDHQLDADEQRAFDAALANDAALADKYAEFCSTLATLKASDAQDVHTPDLLAGVQRKLRIKSGGRFYADRFSERAGWASRQLFGVLLMAAILLALVWLAFGAFYSVHVTP